MCFLILGDEIQYFALFFGEVLTMAASKFMA